MQNEINEQVKRIEGLIDEENVEMKKILSNMIDTMNYSAGTGQ